MSRQLRRRIPGLLPRPALGDEEESWRWRRGGSPRSRELSLASFPRQLPRTPRSQRRDPRRCPRGAARSRMGQCNCRKKRKVRRGHRGTGTPGGAWGGNPARPRPRSPGHGVTQSQPRPAAAAGAGGCFGVWQRWARGAGAAEPLESSGKQAALPCSRGLTSGSCTRAPRGLSEDAQRRKKLLFSSAFKREVPTPAPLCTCGGFGAPG